ncbi:hypothetical protein SAMN03080610_03736, partial [Afifella marina DSM 2698]
MSNFEMSLLTGRSGLNIYRNTGGEEHCSSELDASSLVSILIQGV